MIKHNNIMTVHTVKEFMGNILTAPNELDELVILYRGQGNNSPLLPAIARKDIYNDTSTLEETMLEQLKRRSKLVVSKQLDDDWDWLVYAQHYGMNTRLLDWTSNPLVALWFGANDAIIRNSNAYIYILVSDENMILDRSKIKNPFSINTTKIFSPNLNNERIVAQAGWFTAHAFAVKGKKWIPLENNRTIKDYIFQIIIPNKSIQKILYELNILGINSQSLFPDISGLCQHLNWLAQNKKLNN